jgi:hypothetical protein
MRKNNQQYDLRRAVLFVEACEKGVARQRQLIARLIGRGQSTRDAKIALAEMEQRLLALRNYHEVLQSLHETYMPAITGERMVD